MVVFDNIRGYTIILMAHTRRDKDKLLKRVARIQGQVEALKRAIEEEQECSSVLQILASCRGGFNGLMGEIIEGYVRCHVLGEDVIPERGAGGSAHTFGRRGPLDWCQRVTAIITPANDNALSEKAVPAGVAAMR
jgi:DNA-binding FrmR family transcriptional regulator